jgi:DNA polymerase III gamma/tau subunit
MFTEHRTVLLIAGGVAAGGILLLRLKGSGSSNATVATPAGYVPGPVAGANGTSQGPDVGAMLSEVTSAQTQQMQAQAQIAQQAQAQQAAIYQSQQAADASQNLSTFQAFGQELASERNSFDQLLGSAVSAETMQQQQNQQQLNSEASNMGNLLSGEVANVNALSGQQSNLLQQWAASVKAAILPAPAPAPAPAPSGGYSGAPGEQYNTVPAGAPPTFANQTPAIRSEFINAFGANAQADWQTQHNAQVNQYGS